MCTPRVRATAPEKQPREATWPQRTTSSSETILDVIGGAATLKDALFRDSVNPSLTTQFENPVWPHDFDNHKLAALSHRVYNLNLDKHKLAALSH